MRTLPPPVWARSVLIGAFVCGLVAMPTGCARYRPTRAAPETTLASLPDAPTGSISFREAARLLVDRHPELQALRMHAAAPNPDPHPRTLNREVRTAEGADTQISFATEVLGLLNIGPRLAARWWAQRVVEERWLRHHERARALVGDLAEAFVVHAALARHRPVLEAPDTDPLASAGLLPDAQREAAEAVRARIAAELRLWDLEAEGARERIAALTGARASAEHRPLAVASNWPRGEPLDRERLLLARGDLLRLWGAFVVADSALRVAVAQQLPDVVLRLGATLELDSPFQVLSMTLPLHAPEVARAAERERCAAAARVRAGVHRAIEEATLAHTAHEAARARLDAARAQHQAAVALVRAESAHVETDPGGVRHWIRAHERQAQAAAALRVAAVGLARARVAAARAAGWPAPAEHEAGR